MRDPFTWAPSFGRWFGIQVRVHFFFFVYIVIELYRYAFPAEGLGDLRLGMLVLGILFASVLLHEFGHCFAARFVGGHAEEVVLWPLGGLAFVEATNSPRDQAITAAGGPAVNVLLCGVSALLLGPRVAGALNPLAGNVEMYYGLQASSPVLAVAALVFKLNWILLLFNLLPAFPLDGGRLFRCALWSPMGFGRATLVAVQAGKVTAIGMFVVAVLSGALLLIGVAFFIYLMAERERQMLEAGLLFDDSVFGYDFSQGYTSLENSTTKPRRRVSAWRRWRMRRAQMKRQRELTRQREESLRTDAILAKLHAHGKESLSEEEKRFLVRVSARYRERNRTGE
ncbi:MAG: site-2 protease family protein [Pirellulales bacterium]